jgi:rod shape-determining protein MreC
MRKRRYPLFLLLVVLSAILMFYQGDRGALRPLGFLARPVNILNEAIGWAGSIPRGFFGNFAAGQKELERLRAEVEALRLREQRFKEVAIENRFLRDALYLKARTEGFVAAASVTSNGNGRWSSAFVIDKGRAHSIEKGMAAITPDGLLGKVQEADSDTALILLIDDAAFSAAVRLQDSRVDAIVSGAGVGRAVLKYAGAETPVGMGEVVITSGLDGLFPPGIPVGYVSKVSQGEFFHDIEVTPFVDTRKVEKVIVAGR